jgi:hypothetical protein
MLTVEVAELPEATKTIFGENVTENTDVSEALSPDTTSDAVRLTFPLNPLRLVIIRVLFEELPRGTVKNVGLDVSVKSGLVIVT